MMSKRFSFVQIGEDMIDAVLAKSNIKIGAKISIKVMICVVLIALAVGLPQVVHLVAGASGGATWMPMYLPVLLAGATLGVWWGLGVGVLSPIVSFAITSLAGNAMPTLARLPFMVVELAVFAVVSGLFAKSIVKNKWMSFASILLAQTAGRLTFLALVAIFQNVSSLSVAVVLPQMKAGLVGLSLQAVILPFVVMGLSKLLLDDKKKDAGLEVQNE